MLRKFKILPLVICIVLFLIQCTYQNDHKKEIQPLKVAVNMPLTGNLAIFGIPVQQGLLLAYKQATSHGLIKPEEIEFDFEDNKGRLTDSLTIWHKQKLKNPNVYISGVGINTTVFNNKIEKTDIPHIIYGWAIGLTKNTHNTLRCWLHYKLELQAYLEYINTIQPKKIVIIYANYDPYVELVNKYLVPELKGQNIDMVTYAFEPDTKDFNTIITKIKSHNPNLIILDAFPHELGPLVKALLAFNMLENSNVLGTMDFIDAPKFLSSQELENIIFPAPAYVVHKDSQAINNWQGTFKEYFKQESSYTAAYAYDLFNILLSVHKQHPTASGQDLIQLLKQTKTQGITGQIEFDKDGDLVTDIFLVKYKNGKIVRID